MTSTRKRNVVLGASLATVLLAGGLAVAGSAAANAAPVASPSTTLTAASTPGSASGQNAEGEASDGTSGAPAQAEQFEQSEQSESAALAGKTTVTPAQAAQAATATVKGSTVVASTLGDENGQVIYEVTVKDASGATSDVTVDALTGQVVADQAGQNDQAGQGEQADGSGADSETNDGPAPSTQG